MSLCDLTRSKNNQLFSEVDRNIYMSLHNLARAKNAKKVFMCKKCQLPINTKGALKHFDYHLTRDKRDLVKYCGHCDQTFFMKNDKSRELMYRRHVYECLSNRQCSGKLFESIQHCAEKANLLSPFLVNVERAENINEKRSAIPSSSVGLASPSSLPSSSAAVTSPAAWQSEPVASTSSSHQPKDVYRYGVPVLSEQAEKQYLEKINLMDVAGYWQEKKNNQTIRQSLSLALGKFASPFKHQTEAEKYFERERRGCQDFLFNEGILDHRYFFRQLLAIVRKKLQQGSRKIPVFRCGMTGAELKIDVDLLRHMREHSDASMVRVCCKCNARFIFSHDYEENIYLYHILYCILKLRSETDDDMKTFINICRKGYLIDPSCPETFDESAFLKNDRLRAFKGYRQFLSCDRQANNIFAEDSDAMHRVLQMFPTPNDSDNPVLDMQMRDTLRFYNERFEEMLDYEFRCIETSSKGKWYDEQQDFNCRKCAKDKRAIDEGLFDRYMNALGDYRMNIYRQIFLSNDTFLSRFPPKWLIDIDKANYHERLPVEMGFYFWLVLIAKKLPYKNFSLFNDEEKKTKAIFMHIFVYMRYAKEILEELLSDVSSYYILPYSCLCRDASIACCVEGNQLPNDDNTHRHIIVVFRNKLAFSPFARKTNINELDRQRVRQQNCRRSTVCAARRKNAVGGENSQDKETVHKNAQIKTKYMIPILNHVHYYHAIRYVSRDKVALNLTKPSDENEPLLCSVLPKKANKRSYSSMSCQPQEADINQSQQSDGTVINEKAAASVGHTRFSRHFYFSIPMVYHAKPCFFLLYPDGLSDWLTESFVVKHLLYRLLRCVRQKNCIKNNLESVEYVVYLSDVAPYLNGYIGGHGFPLKVTPRDVSYPSERSAAIECANAGIFIVSNRIDFNHVCYFDDLSHIQVRLQPKLLREIKWLESTHYQLVRFNLAMYQNLRGASEKIFWLNQRNLFLSGELKRLINESKCGDNKLTEVKKDRQFLQKRVENLEKNVTELSQLNSSKEEKIVKLQQQISYLMSAIQGVNK